MRLYFVYLTRKEPLNQHRHKDTLDHDANRRLEDNHARLQSVYYDLTR